MTSAESPVKPRLIEESMLKNCGRVFVAFSLVSSFLLFDALWFVTELSFDACRSRVSCDVARGWSVLDFLASGCGCAALVF